MTYRIAVCLSGEPRTWRIAAPAILSYFDIGYAHNSEPVQVDYFIHTWKSDSWRATSSAAHEQVSLTDPGIDIGDKFAPVGMRTDPPLENNTVWGSLFTSQHKSFLLKREHELKMRWEYDVVVKSRLDTIFPPGRKFQTHDMAILTAFAPEPLFRMPTEYNAPNFNEVVYYGDSPTMDLIGDVLFDSLRDCDWGRYHRLASGLREQPRQKFGPGAFMFDYMTRHRINPGHAPTKIDWTIVRREAADRGLDAVKDYAEIVRIHRDHYNS